MVEIEKITEIIVYTTDGNAMEAGAMVVFESGGRCFCGTYKGITKKGALMFDSVISGTKVTFNVMPNSIERIYLADVNILKETEEQNESND